MIFLNDDFNDQAYTNDVTQAYFKICCDFQVLGNVTITRPILTLHVLASETAGLQPVITDLSLITVSVSVSVIYYDSIPFHICLTYYKCINKHNCKEILYGVYIFISNNSYCTKVIV